MRTKGRRRARRAVKVVEGEGQLDWQPISDERERYEDLRRRRGRPGRRERLFLDP
jgi:hypothetical protein